MLRTARSFRHALIRPAAALAVATVVASGLVLAPAAPAVAAERVGTRLAISPYRQDRYVGQNAAFSVTLTGADGARLAGQPVTFWTRSVTTSTWSKFVTRNTSSSGVTGIVFSVRGSTYVRAEWAGNTRYAPTGTVTAGVVAHKSMGPQVVSEASRHAGKPYQWGATGPTRFDCSGFTLYVFGRFGKSLPHNSRQQYSAVRHISRSSMQVGDLIFIGSSTDSIGHVGIYAGNGEMWHSPHSGDVVKRSKIYSSSYYVGRVA